ncbi:hypothetical protein JW960_01255 [candidate division KSB1 bacterium]|nr:hypothetical protein [candidate division KSB1 bacterium]
MIASSITHGFVGFVLIIIALYFIIPRTRWIKYIELNTTAFVITHVFGIIYAALSLVLILLFPDVLLQQNVWLILVAPYIVLTFYWMITRQQLRIPKRYEDRQILSSAKIATMLIVFSMVGMLIILLLFHNSIIGGYIWLPLYIFITMFINSIVSLIIFKRL